MIRLLVLLILLTASPLARGFIVYGGNGSGNTTGVGAGSGWDYVGAVNGATGVLLGAYDTGTWVLTAAHVGAGAFSLGGTSYSLTTDAPIQLTNLNGSGADLLLFRISSDPGLARLTLASTPPTIGTSLMHIGNGFGRAENLTYWDSDWNETNALLGTRQGYKWAGPQQKRWGTNTVSAYSTTEVPTASFYTTFTANNGRAQATTGDSGGGVFTSGGALAGITHVVSSFNGQPGGTSVVNNRTYSADISQYRGQILDAIMMAPVAVPEPAAAAIVLLLAPLLAIWLRTRRAAPR